MVEIDAKDGTSLRNASSRELLDAFKKYDLYFDFGPKMLRLDYLDKISNVLLEIRARKSAGEHLSGQSLLDNGVNRLSTRPESHKR